MDTAGSRAGWAGAIAAGAATGAASSLFAFTRLQDRDWPWHLADWQRMATEGRLPWDDRWSWASSGPHVPVHWLFEVLLGLAHRAFGLDGILAVRMGLVALVFFALHRALARRGLPEIAASASALLVAALCRSRLLERPHLLTMLGLVLLWDQLATFREGKRRHLALLLPLVALWANAHPGVVYGAIVLVGFLVSEAVRVPLGHPRVPDWVPELRAMPARRVIVLAAWTAAALLATIATPYGVGLYPYLLAHRDMQRWSRVAELRPLDFSQGWDYLFACGVALATLVIARAAWHHRRRPLESPVDLTDLGAAAGFVALAATAAREAGLALEIVALAAAPSLAATIREAQDELRDKERGLHVFAWVFGLVVGFGYPAWSLVETLRAPELGRGLRKGSFPVLEADWILKERPRGPLFNSNGTGGYLIWRLDPERNPDWKVFSDGRQPLYRHALGRTLPEIDRAHPPNLLVLDFLSVPWERDFAFLSEPFALVHFSDGGRTYVRTSSASPGVLARAYGHVGFRAAKDPDARAGWRLTLVVDEANPQAALAELRTGVAREEPDGYWANVGLARVFLALRKPAEAAEAAQRALATRAALEPGYPSHDAREILAGLSEGR